MNAQERLIRLAAIKLALKNALEDLQEVQKAADEYLAFDQSEVVARGVDALGTTISHVKDAMDFQ